MSKIRYEYETLQYFCNGNAEKFDASITLKNKFEHISNKLYKLLKYTYYYVLLIKYNADNDFAIIHNSNMSKLCNSEQEAIDTVEKYKKDTTVYKSPTYKKINKYYKVYDADTSKILKSINFSLPNLEKFIV